MAALPVFIIGGVLFFAADAIVALAYRSADPDDESSDGK
jgi:hypothetical protein